MEKLPSSVDNEISKSISRVSFWEYEKYINPTFFHDGRKHLKVIADTLQSLIEGKLLKADGKPYTKLIMNLPPRHGKSYSLTNLSQWVLGRDNTNKIITACYNETLSTRFSKSVRDGIEATKLDEKIHIFSDIFPLTKIKKGDASMQLWSLDGQFFNYLGSSFKGTITGLGCNIGIIDDPIKNKMEAYNDRVLDEQWEFYTDTFLSRIEESGIQILNMTRWANKDLCGRLIELESEEWYVLKMPVIDENNKMLCDELLSYESFIDKSSKTSKEIMSANYMQEPIDIQGRLYKNIKTYNDIPRDINGKVLFTSIENYTDTADTGDDYLCSVDYGVYNKEAYIINVTYTTEGMEITEEKTASMLNEDKVNIAKIESNNGGRGFARNIDRILKEKHNSNRTVIKWFHQSQNKKARILSNSSWVQEHIYFPVSWADRWAEFYRDVTSYQKEGKNKNDDAPDVLSGIAENIGKPVRRRAR